MPQHDLLFVVHYPSGGYRAFKHFDTFNAYLKALEAMGRRWVMLNDCSVRVQPW